MSIAYPAVNEAINKVFFDGRFANRPVYLSLTDSMQEEIAKLLDIESFKVKQVICRSVGQWLDHTGNPYSRAEAELRIWRARGMQAPPPISAVLYCLSHAAAIMAAEDGYGGNNYYQRLSQVSGVDRDRLAINGRHTDKLWDALKDWLTANKFALGRPTAQSVNSWRYVGKAISQAIVRAGDREHFHDLFERYGFSGNETISNKEMMHYLGHWFENGHGNATLKRAWDQRELRDRVADAALAELFDWSQLPIGAAEIGHPISARKLSLVANLIPGIPRPSLELHLGRLGADETERSFKLEGDSSEYYLANDTFGAFSTISPSPLALANRGLGRSYKFLNGHQCELEWVPRPIILLKRSPDGPFWVETTRISFGSPHLIFVRDVNNLPQKVEAYLADVALTSPGKATSRDLNGMPQGWLAYKDVQVRAPSQKLTNQELECLVPLGGESAIAIESSLQLAPGIYHGQVELSVQFIASKGPTAINATSLPPGDRVLSAQSESNECKLHLERLPWGQKDTITVRALQGEASLEEIEAIRCDANSPTPLSQDTQQRLTYRDILSARPASNDSNIDVEGVIVRGNPAPRMEVAVDPNRFTSQICAGNPELSQAPHLTNVIADHLSLLECVEKGHRVWHCQTLPPGRPRNTPLKQTCQKCGYTLLAINRGQPTAQAIPTRRVQTLSIDVRAQSNPVDHDILLDALSFLGTGSWSKFQTLIGNNESDPLFSRRTIHEYFLLGFLDLELRAGSNSIRAWRVPRPSINFVGNGLAILSGFRCHSLVGAIEAKVSAIGGALRRTKIAGRPTLLAIEGLSFDCARSKLSEIRDPLERNLVVLEDASTNISRACIGFGPIDSHLIAVSIGRPRNLERFDVAAATWREAEAASSAGCYRWNEGYQCYAFVDQQGAAFQGQYQVVKLLAAKQAGIRLHGYDAAGQRFLSTLGCDPPGLLSRALVASSGCLPVTQVGMQIYPGVPAEVASNILKMMYEPTGVAQ